MLFVLYVVPSHIHLGAFSGFSIISFNNLVNVKWDDGRAFNQKFGTLSVTGDFNFWNLVNAALRSSFAIPVSLASHFLSPYYLSSFQTYYKLFSLPISLCRSFLYCPQMVFPLPQLGFFLFLYRIFWHPSERYYLTCKICYVY